MTDVARRLKLIVKDMENASLRKLHSTSHLPRNLSGITITSANPWHAISEVEAAMVAFPLHIKDPEERSKLKELSDEVERTLGTVATSARSGVFTMPTLYLYLCQSEMDVQNAKDMAILVANARKEFEVDKKRQRIIEDDLSYDTLPRFKELLSYQPTNNFVGRGKDGRLVQFIRFGSELEGIRKAFTIEDYTGLAMMGMEVTRIIMEAMAAVDGKRECIWPSALCSLCDACCLHD